MGFEEFSPFGGSYSGREDRGGCEVGWMAGTGRSIIFRKIRQGRAP